MNSGTRRAFTVCTGVVGSEQWPALLFRHCSVPGKPGTLFFFDAAGKTFLRFSFGQQRVPASLPPPRSNAFRKMGTKRASENTLLEGRFESCPVLNTPQS